MIDALASPVRREILWLTWTDELSAGEIGSHFDLSGATLSSHLAALTRAGLVRRRVDGNFRRYRCDHDAVRAVVPLLATNDERWRAADDIPERDLADSRHGFVAIIGVDVELDPDDAFDAFADAERYSAWLGVPVEICDGRFRTTLEWGTEVRGSYEVVCRPDLIAMRWDLEDDAVPVPGAELVAYLRVLGTRSGSRVEVHQLAADATQLAFLTDAWSMVLGRFADAHRHGTGERRARAPRPKRRPGSDEPPIS